MNVCEEQAVPVICQTKKYVDSLHPSALFTIYDSPPGTSCPVIEVTKDADFVILVTEPTPFGLHDLRLAAETMRKISRPFAVVINRDGIGDDRIARYCEKERIKVIARIPNKRVIAEHYSRGELIYQRVPEFRKQLIRIITHILTFNQITP
jgi:MinD superfamily P-loop ATPase